MEDTKIPLTGSLITFFQEVRAQRVEVTAHNLVCSQWALRELSLQAMEALDDLRSAVDTLIVIPNDKLLEGE